MPMPDPLDNIMKVLQNKGTVDPNQAAARSARIKKHRTGVGANPQATKKPPEQRAAKKDMPPDVMPQVPGGQKGISPDVQDNPNMMSVVVDAMNEAIIGIKTEIHRAKDNDTKRNLEKQAQSVRQQITDMGGEPIYADESIEEGLKKLRGHGMVTATETGGFGYLPSWVRNVGPADEQPKQTDQGAYNQDKAESGSMPASSDPFGPASSLFGSTTSIKTPTVTAPRVTAPQVELPEIPGPMTADHGPDYFGEHVADPTRDGAVDELEELIGRVTGREMTPMPEMQVDSNTVNELIQQYGLEPRSEEEIAETAKVIVDRQKLSQEQRVQRDIERFEREHGHEFAKAEKQIQEAAKRASADKQEEMAARGMFYSSIMGNALSDITDKEMDLIGEIAIDAANYVAELHTDLKDIAQWAVLEEEFVKREMEEQNRALSHALMTMHLEVAMWGDQMAADRWYKENSMQLQHDQMSLQGIQVKMAYAEQQGQNLASAFMADHPLVQNTLVGMGISQEKFAQMTLEQQAGLVRTTVGFNEVEQQMRMNELQMRAVVAELAMQNASMQLQASIASAQMSMQAQIASGQFAMQGLGMAMELSMHRDKMDLAWANYGLDAQSLAARLAGGSGGSSSQSQGLSTDLFMQGRELLMAGDAGGYSMFLAELKQSGFTETAHRLQMEEKRLFSLPSGAYSDPGSKSTPTTTTQTGGSAYTVRKGSGFWDSLVGGNEQNAWTPSRDPLGGMFPEGTEW